MIKRQRTPFTVFTLFVTFVQLSVVGALNHDLTRKANPLSAIDYKYPHLLSTRYCYYGNDPLWHVATRSVVYSVQQQTHVRLLRNTSRTTQLNQETILTLVPVVVSNASITATDLSAFNLTISNFFLVIIQRNTSAISTADDVLTDGAIDFLIQNTTLKYVGIVAPSRVSNSYKIEDIVAAAQSSHGGQLIVVRNLANTPETASIADDVISDDQPWLAFVSIYATEQDPKREDFALANLLIVPQNKVPSASSGLLIDATRSPALPEQRQQFRDCFTGQPFSNDAKPIVSYNISDKTLTLTNEHYGTHVGFFVNHVRRLSPVDFNRRRKKRAITANNGPLNPSLMVLPCVKIDIRGELQQKSSYSFSLSDFVAWESIYGRVPFGGVIILQTGLFNALRNASYVDRAVVRELFIKRGLVALGTDAAGFDYASYNAPCTHQEKSSALVDDSSLGGSIHYELAREHLMAVNGLDTEKLDLLPSNGTVMSCVLLPLLQSPESTGVPVNMYIATEWLTSGASSKQVMTLELKVTTLISIMLIVYLFEFV